MKGLDNLRQLLNKETIYENESKKMPVLIRKLCLVLIAYFACNVMVLAVMGQAVALAGNLAFCLLYFAILILSYRAHKMSTVWCFIGLTAIWGFAMLCLFGFNSSFQIFPAFLIIIFFFAINEHFVAKAIFSAILFAVYLIMFNIFGDNAPFYSQGAAEQKYIRDATMFVVLLCICISVYTFSNESQSLEGKLIEYNKKLKEKANTDPLTGLNNRGMAMEYLEDFAKKADEMICSICICDIDHFKRVNDSYGHDIGDLVLKAVAKVLMNCTAGQGFVARWGGEEFFIAFPKLNGDEAVSVLYTIQSELRKTVVMSGDQKIRVTLTYGLTEYDRNLPLDQNIKDADNKLYMGKEQGRDRIMY